MKKISIVIPVFNEQESLNELFKTIKSEFSKSLIEYSHEVIFVNDGSSDNSLEVLKNLNRENTRVKIISFRKNMGKASALSEGFKKAEGDYILTMDADLQDGIENLPLLIKKMDEGLDIVIGWKRKREDSFSKIIPSKCFNFFVSFFSGIKLHDFNSGLKLMKNNVAKEIYLYGEMHRFIPVLAVQRGFKVGEVAVSHSPRKYGKSKYSWDRFFKGFYDFLTVMFLTGYGQRPLHLFGTLGLISVFFGVLMGTYLSILHFQGESISRRPLLNLSVLLIVSGVQFFSTGFTAEMIVSHKRENTELPIDYES